VYIKHIVIKICGIAITAIIKGFAINFIFNIFQQYGNKAIVCTNGLKQKKRNNFLVDSL
jgi:hypothetical protein